MNIVIINGWAMPASIWTEFCDQLKIAVAYDNCQVIDIDRCLTSSEWIQYLDEIIKPNTLLIGWSLGGMLSLEYAHQHPEKVLGLCTLQMNPKFVTGSGWSSAMEPGAFQEFKQLAECDAKSMTKRFGFLVTAKGLDGLGDLKKLKQNFTVSTIPPVDVLQNSLELLETLDTRAKLGTLRLPQLHIYGENDQLVPKATAKQVEVLNDQVHIELIEGVSHFPCYSAASRIIERITQFAGGLN
jgi:pimeloyl-ACP methyl ester esterase